MRQLLIIFAFIFAMPALCFGGKYKEEVAVFDFRSGSTIVDTDEPVDINGTWKGEICKQKK